MGYVEEFSAKAGLRHTPKLFIYESRTPNAHAFINGSMAISSRYLEMLNPQEIREVLGHEITHLLHQRARITIRGALIGAQMALVSAGTYLLSRRWLGDMQGWKKPTLSAAIFAGLTSILDYPLHFATRALTRALERDADRGSAIITQETEALGTKFEKLKELSAKSKADVREIPATTPNIPKREQWARRGPVAEPHLPAWKKKMQELTRTHPEHDERIATSKRLDEMKKKGELDGKRPTRYF